ncbi:molybdopterin molybdenumtransferase MoeA [Rhodobacteraceae bacterium RKSG542]|uniref:molybdopterin molybdotransferase MoeA n=1 Tax=Pseudovibrio flavus TaxID=2529854 RepID=UPI0012BD6A11|nr:gephyrin-like molybdotransferase Glp [Pseudovibrio flavus]MTI16652.1 molybdopterin molybdenumtransferase MoeA [Pseudovibrio flavus]
MGLISIEHALEQLLGGLATKDSELVSLADAGGRTLAEDIKATRTHPPFSASAMDGYAVVAADTLDPKNPIKVIGEIAAGSSFSGTMKAGEALRIFTGAPVPEGADAILIQENATRDGDTLFANEPVSKDKFIRPKGLDFSKDDTLLARGQKLGFRELSLAASMNHAALPVFKKPLVAILANGDELVEPGKIPGPNQIVASNQVGVAELARSCGADTLMLGIAPDDQQAIGEKVAQAIAAKADILVTLGGASVGEHDLIKDVLGDAGMNLEFWRIAMRPGKPLMAGSLGPMKVLGLPGNPVSSLVCSLLFLQPMLGKLTGAQDAQSHITLATLGADMEANDLRQDYIRATLEEKADGSLIVTPFSKQDSSMLALFTRSDALIIRKPFAEPAKRGEIVEIVQLGAF